MYQLPVVPSGKQGSIRHKGALAMFTKVALFHMRFPLGRGNSPVTDGLTLGQPR